MNNIIAYLIANQFITCLVTLPFVLLFNIALGWAIANFRGSFDRARFFLGFKKGLTVYLSIVGLSVVAKVLVIADLDLVGTMFIIMISVEFIYIAQCLEKIKTIVNFKGPEAAKADLQAVPNADTTTEV